MGHGIRFDDDIWRRGLLLMSTTVGAFKKARDDANRLSYRDHNIRGDRTLRGVAAMSNERQHIIRDALNNKAKHINRLFL